MIVPDDVIVIVPTYNEAENLAGIATAVRIHGYRLLVVDDGSPDGTGEIADALVKDDEGVAVLHRDTKAGLGKAYAAGFARALELDDSVLCEMDADSSHDPGDLPRLIAVIDEGADLAIDSRYVPGSGVDGWPWHRRAIPSGGNRYAALMLDIKVRTQQPDFEHSGQTPSDVTARRHVTHPGTRSRLR